MAPKPKMKPTKIITIITTSIIQNNDTNINMNHNRWLLSHARDLGQKYNEKVIIAKLQLQCSRY